MRQDKGYTIGESFIYDEQKNRTVDSGLQDRSMKVLKDRRKIGVGAGILPKSFCLFFFLNRE